MKFDLYRSEQSEFPFLTMEAENRYAVPDKIEDGKAPGPSSSAYAKRLAKSANASVAAIASRMGPTCVIKADGDEPGLDDMINKARMEITEGDDDTVDLMASGVIQKSDDEQQIVFGWAYVTHDKDGTVNIDKSGDFVDAIEEIEKSAYDFVLNSRASDADHTNVKGGTLVESIVFTPEKIEKMGLPEGAIPLGWWLGFKIEDDTTWQRVKKGELTSFSVHGSGVRSKVEPE